jgi:hypothetical protein
MEPKLIAVDDVGGKLWQTTPGGFGDLSVMAVYEENGHKSPPIPLQTWLKMSPYWNEVNDAGEVIARWDDRPKSGTGL